MRYLELILYRLNTVTQGYLYLGACGVHYLEFCGIVYRWHTLTGKLHLSGSQNDGDAQHETK